MGIFGPSLGPELSSGFELLKILDGSMKAVPNISLGIVDVRDVADLHIRAMTNPAAKGQRSWHWQEALCHCLKLQFY